MHHGILHFPTAGSIPFPELAREAEARGLESLWIAEHSHVPAVRRTPFPAGGELPQYYYETLDPFVALAAAAAVTSRIRLATGVCLVIQRDPIHTAKEVASLDVLSGGRVIFGVGAGWLIEEMRNHGTDTGRRFGILRERVEAMKAIWTQEPAEYHGQHVNFDPLHQQPKPVQKPHPPIHVGGGWPGAAKRAVAWADGWAPLPRPDGSGIVDKLPLLRELEAEAGRAPGAVALSVYNAPTDAGQLAQYRDAGVARVLYQVPSLPRDDVMPLLDRFATLARTIG